MHPSIPVDYNTYITILINEKNNTIFNIDIV